MSSPFYEEAKRFSNLFGAWRHVRQRALSSSQSEIRAAAAEFESESQSRLKSIQMRLAHETYAFPKAEGVLKDKRKREKQGKDPRPIVVATLESRVVQRSILQALQPDRNSRLYARLNGLKEVIESPYSLGGNPEGGVPKSISAVLHAVADGYTVFYKSDIKEFFTKIPHEPVLQFIQDETEDAKITELFGRALAVELENREQLGRYFSLFPFGGVGVPQGSSLSAFSGNILLNEFDRRMNQLQDVRSFRYIDDLIILGKFNEAVLKARSRAEALLRTYGMKLYDPATSPDKAEIGPCRDGFVYLGCAIHGTQISPAPESKARLIQRIDETIAAGKRDIESKLDQVKPGAGRPRGLIQSLEDINLAVYGWGQSYNFISNRRTFTQLDREIDARLARYRAWFSKVTRSAEPKQLRRMIGVSLLSDTEQKPLPRYGS